MRIVPASIFILGISTFLAACADSDPGEGVGINRGALGSAPSNPALDAIGARHIVKFYNANAGKSALRGAGAQIVLELGPQNAAAAHIPPQALEALARNPNIEYIEEDAIRKPLAIGDGSELVPYGFGMVQADQVAFDAGSGIKLCIIDSGFMVSHQDLQDGAVSGYPAGWNVDNCGHGTHVGGTIAAIGGNGAGVVGVIPTGASAPIDLHIIKVFGNGTPGNCAWTYSSSLVDALNRCVSAGSDVVSMSLGGGRQSRTERIAFDSAYANGVLSIAAAGNDGDPTVAVDALSYPASYDSVMSVAALDANKVHADFSQKNSQVEIAAPGVSVLSTVPYVTDASLTIGTTKYSGSPIEFAASSSGATGALVSGGLCNATNTGWAGKVVLCERGSISFYDKVHNVQLSGGVAAVIYNNAPGGFVGTLGEGSTSTIPGISLSQEDGQYLISNKLGSSATVVNTTTWGVSGYSDYDGTSMATPHVSGVAALVWSNFPGKTAAEIRNALTSTAKDLGPAGKDNSYGYGLVQAKAAHDLLATAGGGGGGGGSCTPTETMETACGDGLDNDCDGLVDGNDPDCANSCPLGQRGDSCTSGAECCSGSCGGKPRKRTCK